MADFVPPQAFSPPTSFSPPAPFLPPTSFSPPASFSPPTSFTPGVDGSMSGSDSENSEGLGEFSDEEPQNFTEAREGDSAKILEREYSIHIRDWMVEAFNLYSLHKKQYIVCSVGFFLLILILAIPPPARYAMLPIIGLVLTLFKYGIIYASLQVIRTTGGKNLMKAAYFWDGIKQGIPLLCMEFVMSVLVALGLLCFILPGIWLSVCFMFSLHTRLEYPELGMYGSASVSFRQVHKHWFQVFGLFLVCFFLSGFIVTIPYVIILGCVAFKNIIGMKEHYFHLSSK